jgi:hypothetical protein
MDDIRLEYVKRYEEEERYRIYHNDRLLDAVIVVSHIAKNISFDRFVKKNYYDIERIAPEIFKLFEEYIMPEYRGYKVWYEATIGNELYLKWRINNDMEV